MRSLLPHTARIAVIGVIWYGHSRCEDGNPSLLARRYRPHRHSDELSHVEHRSRDGRRHPRYRCCGTTDVSAETRTHLLLVHRVPAVSRPEPSLAQSEGVWPSPARVSRLVTLRQPPTRDVPQCPHLHCAQVNGHATSGTGIRVPRVSVRSAGLAAGHCGCGRTCPREGIGAAQSPGSRHLPGHALDQVCRLSAGHPGGGNEQRAYRGSRPGRVGRQVQIGVAVDYPQAQSAQIVQDRGHRDEIRLPSAASNTIRARFASPDSTPGGEPAPLVAHGHTGEGKRKEQGTCSIARPSHREQFQRATLSVSQQPSLGGLRWRGRDRLFLAC